MFCLFIVVGAVFCVLGTWQFKKARSFVAGAQRAPGRIVDSAGQFTQTDVQTVSYPVVEFATADGKTVRFERRLSSIPGAPGIGKEVTVLYPPASPDDAVVDSFVELYGAPFIFFSVGALWVVVTSVLWLLSVAGVVTPNQ